MHSRGRDIIRCGKLNLVDLAGTENISRSGAKDVSNLTWIYTCMYICAARYLKSSCLLFIVAENILRSGAKDAGEVW